jgi:membrane-associated phospholipid phosphatase
MGVLFASLGGLSVLLYGVRRGRLGPIDSRWTARVGVKESDGRWLASLAEPRSIAIETLAIVAAPSPLRPQEKLQLLASTLFAGLGGHALKKLVCRARPTKHRFEPDGDESFPSTHTANATALATALATIAYARRGALWPFLPAAAVGLAVGRERIRVAAHWPTDVAAGLLLGFAGNSATSLILSVLGRHET